MKALVIDDDRDTVEAVDLALKMAWPGSDLVSTHLGRKGIELVESDEPDIVILDIVLPDLDGFEVLKRIRSFSTVPIILLTIAGDDGSMAKGLELGADDYAVKPCGQLQLMARIKAKLRDKSRGSEEGPVSCGSLSLDPVTRELRIDGRRLKLTRIEAIIMQCLIRNEGRVVTFSRFAEVLWADVDPWPVDSLRVHIWRLRKKIEDDPSRPEIILTNSGIGYQLGEPRQ